MTKTMRKVIIETDCGKVCFPCVGVPGVRWLEYAVRPVEAYGETHYEAHFVKAAP